MAKGMMLKERTLLLHSEVIKQYPEVLKILRENDKISEQFIEGLPEKQRNFFENILPNLLKQAINEWKGDLKRIEDMGSDKSKWKRCMLDNCPNRYIFYITNQRNNTSLNVGSECIKHFWNSWYGAYEGKSIEQLKKDATRLKLLSDLNDKIPGIGRIIDSWGYLINDCVIILPRYLEEQYKELGRLASTKLEQYLNGEPIHEEKFRSILDQRAALIEKINRYIREKSSDKYVPKKEIRLWLERHGQNETIGMLKDDGAITWRTAHRIWEPAFMKSIVPDLNEGIKSIGLQITSVDNNRNGYVIKTQQNNMIYLFAKHKELILSWGSLLFNEKHLQEFTLENFIEVCVLNKEKDVEAVLEELNSLSYHLGIRIEEPDLEFSEVAVFDEKIKKYVIVEPKSLAEKFKGLVIGARDIKGSDLVTYIRSFPGKRYTEKELRERLEIREGYNR